MNGRIIRNVIKTASGKGEVGRWGGGRVRAKVNFKVGVNYESVDGRTTVIRCSCMRWLHVVEQLFCLGLNLNSTYYTYIACGRIMHAGK